MSSMPDPFFAFTCAPAHALTCLNCIDHPLPISYVQLVHRMVTLLLCSVCRDQTAGTSVDPATPKPSKPKGSLSDRVAIPLLLHFVHTARSFHVQLAKAIHTPSRRRDELAASPTLPMQAAAVNLALVLRTSLALAVPAVRIASLLDFGHPACTILLCCCPLPCPTRCLVSM